MPESDEDEDFIIPEKISIARSHDIAGTGKLVENLRREATKVYAQIEQTETTSDTYTVLLDRYGKLLGTMAPFERMPSEKLAGGELMKKADVEDLLRMFFYTLTRSLRVAASASAEKIESPATAKSVASIILNNFQDCTVQTAKALKNEGKIPFWFLSILQENEDEII